MHFILVGLNGDAAQCRIAANIIRFPQVSVTRGKAVFKQFEQVNLAAGFCQRVKVLIVNVNIPVNMRLGNLVGITYSS